MPRFVAPQLATLVERAPTAPEWRFEVKYDGYRVQAVIDRGKVTLFTRNGSDWTARFQPLIAPLSRLAVTSAILDGEVVVLDESGKSVFNRLQQSLDATRDQPLTYFIFDVLQLDGQDLRDEPLSLRRKQLERLLRKARATTRGPIRLGQRLEGSGDILIDAACRLGWEGIIGKRDDAPYRSGRAPTWVKVKCGKRQEFIVIGWTPPQGARNGIGSLLLAVHNGLALTYAGRVGSGFDETTLRDLLKRLVKKERTTMPLGRRPAGLPSGTRWTEPALVVEVAFTEWTTDGLLRHPVFEGVREDKPAPQIVREEPVQMPATSTARNKRARTTAPTGDGSVAGVRISHPERMVFPEAHITKLELAQHFERVAPVMLPHVAGRPLSLVRCPEGSAKECFFQKHWTGTRPPSIDTVPILQGDGKKHPFIVVHDVAGLVTLVQWGVIEIHPWGSRADDPERPDRVIFDLDPGPGVTWGAIQEATTGVRGLLQGLGLDSWLKTSGGKGLHVVVPLARRSSWDDVSLFARGVAEHMSREFPDKFLSKSNKAARKGMIFVDWLRNTRGATAVAPWSTRAREAAGVSVPVAWKELARLRSGDQFTLMSIRDAPPRRDPWADLFDSRQSLNRSVWQGLGIRR